MEQSLPKNEFDEKIRWIESINSIEMDAVLSAIISRYSALFPESELICLLLPRNNMEERQETLQQVMEFLLQHPSEDKN